MTTEFDYLTAFSRNIGWVSESEQLRLRGFRVAIAGLGGAGGVHLLSMARLGIGAFHIADMDNFELVNFNRQVGATMTTLGQPKADVLYQMALDINPDLDLKSFPDGVHENNLDRFLEGVDLYVDGLDFFVMNARRRVFAACTDRGIPAITVAPLGMGAAFLCFMPGKMSFEEYFRLEGQTEQEQLLRFLLGLSPARLQMSYLTDSSRIDLKAHKGPSTFIACQLCAGIAATNAAKILLKRGDVLAAPWGLHFDAYLNRMVKTWRPWGNNNPIQRIAMSIARRKMTGR